MTASFGGQFRGSGGMPGFGQSSGPSGFGAMFGGGMGGGGMGQMVSQTKNNPFGNDQPWYLDENWQNLMKLFMSAVGGIGSGIAGPQARQMKLLEEQEKRSQDHARDIGRVFGKADWQNRRFGVGGGQPQRQQGGGTNYTGRP